jgi:hypothetical protein
VNSTVQGKPYKIPVLINVVPIKAGDALRTYAKARSDPTVELDVVPIAPFPTPKPKATVAGAEAPKPKATMAGAEAPTPKATAAGAEAPKPKATATGAEAPKPKATAAGAEAPKPPVAAKAVVAQPGQPPKRRRKILLTSTEPVIHRLF